MRGRPGAHAGRGPGRAPCGSRGPRAPGGGEAAGAGTERNARGRGGRGGAGAEASPQRRRGRGRRAAQSRRGLRPRAGWGRPEIPAAPPGSAAGRGAHTRGTWAWRRRAARLLCGVVRAPAPEPGAPHARPAHARRPRGPGRLPLGRGEPGRSALCPGMAERADGREEGPSQVARAGTDADGAGDPVATGGPLAVDSGREVAVAVGCGRDGGTGGPRREHCGPFAPGTEGRRAWERARAGPGGHRVSSCGAATSARRESSPFGGSCGPRLGASLHRAPPACPRSAIDAPTPPPPPHTRRRRYQLHSGHKPTNPLLCDPLRPHLATRPRLTAPRCGHPRPTRVARFRGVSSINLGQRHRRTLKARRPRHAQRPSALEPRHPHPRELGP